MKLPSVYFIQAGNDGPVKIGESTDEKKRMASLQTSHHEQLKLLASIPYPVTESEIHSRFSADRIRGEWFFPSPDLMAFIAKAALDPKAPFEVVRQNYTQRLEAIDIFKAALAKHGTAFLPSDLARRMVSWEGYKNKAITEIALLFAARFARARSYEQLIAESEAAELAGTNAPHGALRIVTVEKVVEPPSAAEPKPKRAPR